MSYIKLEKNKLKLNRQIYNLNNNRIFNKITKSKNKKEFDNIIIPEPKKKIKRRIFGDKINNDNSSSVPSESDGENENENDNENNNENDNENDNDNEINDEHFFELEDLKFIKEISNLSLNCEKIGNNYRKNYETSNKINNKNILKEKTLNKENYDIKNRYNINFLQKNNDNFDIKYNKKEFIGKENKINCINNIKVNHLIKKDISDKMNNIEEKLEKGNELYNKFLPCRIEEQTKIYNYIKNGLKTNGNYNSLYIGGMPGTGKSECVKKVIETIENENKENNDIKFRTLFINCVYFPKIKKLFKSIYTFIFSLKKLSKIKSSKYIQLLNNFFYEREKYNGNINLNDPSNSHIIFIIDEIDFLINRSQNILYHIFNWTTYINSKLIIISISNLLNISNKLTPKIISRFGQNKIMFKPYTKEQIIEIINYKGIDINIFDIDALKLSSMKVAAINGDLRRIFLILNKAKELFENDIKNKNAMKDNLINKFYILRACNELFDCKIMNAIKNFKISEKIIISAILYKIIKNNNNIVKLEDIYNSLNIFIYKYNENNYNNGNMDLDITWQEFQKIIYYLLRIKIIELNDKEFINFKDNYIHIKFYVDEFMIACECDEEFKPIFDFLTNLLN